MAELKQKYGFPLFTKEKSTVYLGHEKKLIISDIWAFWDYTIKKKNKDKSFLLSLLEQAKNFYKAAENSPIKSQPLLYYYSFLNLSKIALCLENNFSSNAKYVHGIKERNNNSFQASEVVLNPIGYRNNVQVATELYKLFNEKIISSNTTISLRDLLSHCVGIHRAYSQIYKTPEVFCRLSNLEYYRYAKTIGFKAKIQCTKSQSIELISQNYNVIEEDGSYYFNEEYTMSKYSPSRSDYLSLSQQILSKGVWYFIGNTDYTMYLSTASTNGYPTEMVIYWTMFYLGSITRYSPYLFDEIFSATEQWLMSEFLTTQPKQFLYLSTAKLLGQKALKAYSDI